MPGYKFSTQPELKTIILFIIDSYGKPVDNGPVTDIFMSHEFVDYFTMQTYLDQLRSFGLTEVFEEDGLKKYLLTPLGKEALLLYKDEIPKTVREKILKSIKDYRKEIEEAFNVTANYHQHNELEHLAELSINEGGAPLLSLSVNCGSKETAIAVCRAFRNDPQSCYVRILKVLTGEQM